MLPTFLYVQAFSNNCECNDQSISQGYQLLDCGPRTDQTSLRLAFLMAAEVLVLFSLQNTTSCAKLTHVKVLHAGAIQLRKVRNHNFLPKRIHDYPSQKVAELRGSRCTLGWVEGRSRGTFQYRDCVVCSAQHAVCNVLCAVCTIQFGICSV